MDFVIWMAQMALKVCLIGAGFWVFKTILKNGPDTLKELLQTLNVLIKAGCIKVRRYVAENLKNERKERLQKEEPTATVEAEGSVE